MIMRLMRLEEMLAAFDAAKRKRDIRHEMTPANSAILKEKSEGTFEAVMTGHGNEKFLIPDNGTIYVNCLITDNLLVSKKKLIFLGYLKKY